MQRPTNHLNTYKTQLQALDVDMQLITFDFLPDDTPPTHTHTLSDPPTPTEIRRENQLMLLSILKCTQPDTHTHTHTHTPALIEAREYLPLLSSSAFRKHAVSANSNVHFHIAPGYTFRAQVCIYIYILTHTHIHTCLERCVCVYVCVCVYDLLEVWWCLLIAMSPSISHLASPFVRRSVCV